MQKSKQTLEIHFKAGYIIIVHSKEKKDTNTLLSKQNRYII